MTGDAWRLWVFGSGTALPSVQRDNTYLALAAGLDCWLIDCGSAPYQRLLQAGLSPLRLGGVVLTHSHADHLYGLPALLFQLSLAGYDEVLPIYGLAETLRIAQQIVEAFELGNYAARHTWRVLDARADINLGDSTSVQGTLRVRPVSHSRPALGVRITTSGGQVVAYSGDTQPCPALVELARGAGWLLHECSAPNPFPGHSSPGEAGQLALEAGVSRLGIVHYDPAYVVSVGELVARVRAAGFCGEVRVMHDMDSLTLDDTTSCS